MIGAALCCGKTPSYGSHNLHLWEGKRGPGFGFHCKTCGHNVSILGGDNPEFAMSVWNQSFGTAPFIGKHPVPEPQLNAPEGWRWAQLKVQSQRKGEHDYTNPCVLFHTEHPHILTNKDGLDCLIDDSRLIKDLTLMSIHGSKISLANIRGTRIHAFAWSSTDNRKWYGIDVNVGCCGYRTLAAIRDAMQAVKTTVPGPQTHDGTRRKRTTP